MTKKSALQLKAEEYEHYVTDAWAIDAILDLVMPTRHVIDPCTGTGIIAEKLKQNGHNVTTIDIHDWGYTPDHLGDFLTWQPTDLPDDFTVMMNPPFSKAVQFMERAIELGAAKIICFQRLPWLESVDRKPFWDQHTPHHIYTCASRATCWRFDLYAENKGKTGATTTHAWFVWDLKKPKTTTPTLHRIYKAAKK